MSLCQCKEPELYVEGHTIYRSYYCYKDNKWLDISDEKENPLWKDDHENWPEDDFCFSFSNKPYRWAYINDIIEISDSEKHKRYINRIKELFVNYNLDDIIIVWRKEA